MVFLDIYLYVEYIDSFAALRETGMGELAANAGTIGIGSLYFFRQAQEQRIGFFGSRLSVL
jgi:hypothetical protein